MEPSIAYSTSCPNQSLSTSYWPSVSWSFAQSCLKLCFFYFSSDPFFLFVILHHLKHLHVAVDELEHPDPLDLGEVKQCCCVFIHLGPCYIIPDYFSYWINFRTGGKNSSVYTTPLWFVSPAFFLVSIVKILLFSKNYSKVLHRSLPDLLFTLDFPGTAQDYFSYYQQSGVIHTPRHVGT